MRLAKPFTQLPFRFNIQRLTEEVNQFAHQYWMEHPNKLKGNSAIALVSKEGGDNNEFDGAKAMTSHLQRCDYIQQCMAHFNQVLSRSRLMKLDAGCEVSTHVDFNYHWHNRVRIHIPIITNNYVLFNCGDEQIHMAAGDCWVFDSWRRHQVINSSQQDRVHLVIDTCGDAAFWNMVETMQHLSSDDISKHTTFIDYQSDKMVTLQCEQFSVLPVMAPGECEALVEDLINDFTTNNNNDATIVKHYTQLMRAFTRDWRKLWSLYAHQPQGIPRYQQLIQATRQQMSPNMRAITTASNDIGVNAIFAQRVLNAALNIQEQSRFTD